MYCKSKRYRDRYLIYDVFIVLVIYTVFFLNNRVKNVNGHGGICLSSQHSEGSCRNIYVSSRSVWSIYQVSGQPSLHSETISH